MGMGVQGKQSNSEMESRTNSKTRVSLSQDTRLDTQSKQPIKTAEQSDMTAPARQAAQEVKHRKTTFNCPSWLSNAGTRPGTTLQHLAQTAYKMYEIDNLGVDLPFSQSQNLPGSKTRR